MFHWLAFLTVIGLAVIALVVWEPLRMAAVPGCIVVLSGWAADKVEKAVARRRKAAGVGWDEEDPPDGEDGNRSARGCHCDGHGQAAGRWCPPCRIEHDAYGISVEAVFTDDLEPALLVNGAQILLVDEAEVWIAPSTSLAHLWIGTDDAHEWLLTRQTAADGNPSDTRWWLLDWRDRDRCIASDIS